MFRVPFSITTAVIWYCLRVCKKNARGYFAVAVFLKSHNGFLVILQAREEVICSLALKFENLI